MNVMDRCGALEINELRCWANLSFMVIKRAYADYKRGRFTKADNEAGRNFFCSDWYDSLKTLAALADMPNVGGNNETDGSV